jgi:hypothetical protein
MLAAASGLLRHAQVAQRNVHPAIPGSTDLNIRFCIMLATVQVEAP